MSPRSGHPSRRTLLLGAAAAGATTFLSHPAEATARGSWAVARRLGRYEVLALLDAHGTFPRPAAVAFPDATAADWADARRLDPAAFGPDGGWQLDFRCYAVLGPGGRITLVDTGIGPAGSPAAAWAPVPGHLPQVLDEAGISPEDVDTVVLTHLHEDHYGWSVTPDGTPVFPAAEYVVQRSEVAALTGGHPMSYVVEPLRRTGQLREVDGRFRLAGPGRSGDGLTLLPTPGHTPGHQSVLVAGGDRRLVITGDVLVHAVQLANPAVRYAFESDAATARRSREDLLRTARTTGAVLATAHLNQPFVRLPEEPE